MEIWLDTSSVDLVASAKSLGVLHGVTTNPTILAQAKADPHAIIEAFLEAQDGYVAVQVVAEGSDVSTS